MTVGTDREIVMTRVLEAPRARVFDAWTKPDRVVRWWGPTGFTTPVCKIDSRPGGIYHICMRSPEGQEIWSKGTYCEVITPERIVCTDSFADADGNVVDPSYYGMSATWPREALLTVTFAELPAGRTTLTVRHAVGTATEAEADMCRQGWEQMLDRLPGALSNGGNGS